MNKKRIVIITIIILIIAILIGAFVSMQNPTNEKKQNSRIMITSSPTLNVGDNITIKLTDFKGKPIKNATVNITIFGKDGSTNYNTVITNKEGIGTLTLEKSAGKYTNNATFGGNDKYSGNSTSQKFVIE